jgi:hypothetical protein
MNLRRIGTLQNFEVTEFCLNVPRVNQTCVKSMQIAFNRPRFAQWNSVPFFLLKFDFNQSEQ